MIHCLIVDDEALARQRIRELLADQKDCRVIAECSNGPEAVEAVTRLGPDLLFLDIQMPEMSGIDVLKNLPFGQRPMVILVTAHDHYTLQALEHHAFDYLLKPFDNERFNSSLAHARQQLTRPNDATVMNHQLQQLLDRFQLQEHYLRRVSVKEDDRARVIAVKEIEWIEADRRQVKVHLGQRSYQLQESIGTIETRLDPAQFIRIHRSYIVRCDAICEVQRWFVGSWMLVLASGTKLDVSRTYRDRLARVINLTL